MADDRRLVSYFGNRVWGFRACEALDIRPDRPELAWRVVGEALRGL